MNDPKPCEKCSSIWIYSNEGDYFSDYKPYGHRMNCNCGSAYDNTKWNHSKTDLIELWNKRK